MTTAKEVWIAPGDRPKLKSGEASTIVVRGKPKIHFLRGKDFHSTYGDGPMETLSEEYSSPVVAPIPKKVVELMKQAKRLPESAAIIRLRVEPGVMTEGKLTLQAGKTTDIEMEKAGSGWISKKSLLFVYGDGSADASAFPDIQIIDIGKGDAVGFETEGTFKAGSETRKIGFLDFLIQDPADGKFRSCRYGIFKTRIPVLKLVCPKVGANNMEILLDDGQDDTVDCLDITALLDPTGNITDKADLPMAVDKFTGSWDPMANRSRIYEVAPEPGKDLGLFLLGENRLRVKDKYSGQIIFSGHFLLFDSDEQTIVGSWYGMDNEGDGESSMPMVANHLLLDFKDKTPLTAMAQTLWAWHLVPQGFTPEFGIVQASGLKTLAGKTLAAMVEKITAAAMPDLESAGLDRLIDSAEAVTARLPEGFRPDFVPATNAFTNGDFSFFHHFYMHTFPAHRLIDQVRFGAVPAPAVILEGTHFLNKTFILPSCQPSIQAVLSTRNDNPSMKVAIFGHADATGSEIHNTQLSQFRAEISHALLIKDPDVWLRRIDGSPVVVETAWGTQEIQFMLKALGHYTGTVNGVDDAPTRAASRRFLVAKGLPDNGTGRLDRAARRRLIQDYMDFLVPQALVAADFFQDGAGNPALFAAGENHPLIPSNPNDPQNRRVSFILRATAPVPIDLTQRGAAAPYPQWIAPEPNAPAQGADNPPFIVGCWDSGFGNGDNFSGEALDAPNRLFIRGRRIIRPTLLGATGVTTHRVFRDGDLSGRIVSTVGGIVLRMSDATNPHGSEVMSSMTADGVGNDVLGIPRVARTVVIGTGKDVKFRPLKFESGMTGADFQGALLRYRVFASDPDIKVVSTSIDVRHFSNNNGAGNPFLTVPQRTALISAARAMVKSPTSNKLYFLAAANRRFEPENVARRDAQRTEGGALAPKRSVKRGTLVGNNAFMRNVVCVGASSQALAGGASAGDKLLGNHTAGITEFPTYFTFLGEEVSLAAPGENVRVMGTTNGAPPLGVTVNTNGVFVQCTDGTSFSTPMSAGIAAELMLVNPVLQQPANMPRVIEIMEATADLLPSLAVAPANRRGLYLPGAAANPDPQLTAVDLAGFRRVHFWKAVLAALNDGLPLEQKIPNPAGGANILATAHFTQLTGRDHAATVWYGFEIRSPLAGCGIFFKRADGSFLRIEDVQAALPQGRRAADTWVRAQNYKAPVGHAQAGFVLPNFPFTGAAPVGITFSFMCQFSVKREELARFTHVLVLPPGMDPGSPDLVRAPQLSILALAQITRMRDVANITGPERTGNPDLARIAAHIEDFDDFVFHWTIVPGALQGFVILHREGANAGEDLQVTVMATDSLGNLKSDFNGPVNIAHTGTNGSTAAGVNHGVFINAAAAGASTAINLANGSATFPLRNHTRETFRLRASDGAGHNDTGASPDIHISPPGRVHGIRLEMTHFDGRDLAANPPRTGDRLKAIVTMLDEHDRTKTNFTGRVSVKVIEGRMGVDGPPKQGIHIADAQADAFDSAKFTHAFVAADRGKFEFSLFHYTAGPSKLEATHEALSGVGPGLRIKAGALHHFTFEGPAAQQAGNALTLTVRPQDEFNNLIDDFSGRVALSVDPPGSAGASGPGGNTGVFIGNTQGTSDDNLDFRDADSGAKSAPITAYTAGNYKINAVSGGINTLSHQITVNAPAALASIGFETGLNQANGVHFPVTVIPQDAAGNRLSNFTAAIALNRISGPNALPVNPNHVFVAADNGRFTFDVQAGGAGALVLRAVSGLIQSQITITVR